MKKILFLFMILSSLFLSGCLSYDINDMNKYLDRKNINYEFVEEKQEEDFLFGRYLDKDINKFFYVKESSVKDINSHTNDLPLGLSSLESDYGYVLSDYYLKDYEHIKVYYTTYFGKKYISNVKAIYYFEDRKDFKEKVDEFNSLLDTLKNKNTNCKLSVEFNLNNLLYRYESRDVEKNLDFSILESNYLNELICLQSDELNDFTSEEIENEINSATNRLYIIENDKFIPTNYLSPKNNNFVYNNTIKKILDQEGYKTKEAKDGFIAKNSSGKTKMYSGDMSYLQIEREFNLKLAQKL